MPLHEDNLIREENSMSNKVITLTGGIIEESLYLKCIEVLRDGSGKSRLFGNSVRKLRGDEIDRLELQGNLCADWSLLSVAENFITSAIHHNTFQGACCLGLFEDGPAVNTDSSGLNQGIARSIVIDSEIGSGCCVYNTGVIRNCVIGGGAVILNCGSITASPRNTFGNGIAIAVGNETGGREIVSIAELTVEIAQAVAMGREDKCAADEYGLFAGHYLERCSAPSGYVGAHALVRNAVTIEDSFIGDFSVVTGATLIKNSTLLASPEERSQVSHGAVLIDSCVQWGCEIITMALVDKTVLCEHSHVERHGKVTMSIIGPNSGIAEGEVTSCLLGPFVGFHHQSMLIAALWPGGKGNVAYGANVGSNHTSKAPDQELICGEGIFFGLGTNIKYPADFSNAPYSIIATGVDTLPQRVEFPFSLINKPAELPAGISPSFNEIIPGWVLSQNIYALRRNEAKFGKRNSARRAQFDFRVLRPDTVELMLRARDALKSIAVVRVFYTADEIDGLGKNFMTESARRAAIDAYQFYIEYYSLMKIFERIEALHAQGASFLPEVIFESDNGDSEWNYALKLIVSEGYGGRSLRDNLLRLIVLLNEIADSTFRSKERDDKRGRKIIPDYEFVNTQAIDDSFVKDTMRQTAALSCRIEEILKMI